MTLSSRALVMFPLVTLLLSIIVVGAHLAPSPTPTPLLGVSSFSIDSQSLVSQSLTQEIQIESQLSVAVPHDMKARMTKVIEGKMQMTVRKIEEFGQTLKKRLDDPDTSTSTKECIQQCDEVYAAAVDDIKNSLQDIKDGDLFKANFDINSISTNVDTCQQCFEEMVGEDVEITKFDDWVRRVTDDCLGALDKVVT